MFYSWWASKHGVDNRDTPSSMIPYTPSVYSRLSSFGRHNFLITLRLPQTPGWRGNRWLSTGMHKSLPILNLSRRTWARVKKIFCWFLGLSSFTGYARVVLRSVHIRIGESDKSQVNWDAEFEGYAAIENTICWQEVGWWTPLDIPHAIHGLSARDLKRQIAKLQ